MNIESDKIVNRIVITLAIIGVISVFVYPFIGLLLLANAAVLYHNRKAGITFFNVLTWVMTAIVVVGALVFYGLLNVFIFAWVFSEYGLLTFGPLILFYLGLMIYMHTTRKLLLSLGLESGPRVATRRFAVAIVGAVLIIVGSLASHYVSMDEVRNQALKSLDSSIGR